MYTISQLFIYPVKSLGCFEVSSAQLTDRGFQYDRRWMLVDADNRFITQREYPQMSLLQTAIKDDLLVIYHKNNTDDTLSLPVNPETGIACKVRVWNDECVAVYISEVADEWLSNKLSVSCRLVYMPDSERRKVDVQYAFNNEITGFADAFPLLMIGRASLDDLNSRLEQPLPMNRFRPNIVFTGGQPYDEDTMEHVMVNGIDLYGVKLCARCAITTTDQTNAQRGKEPLKIFAGYRMKNNKVYFGQNMLHAKTGVINVGDEIEVIKTKPPVMFDGQ